MDIQINTEFSDKLDKDKILINIIASEPSLQLSNIISDIQNNSKKQSLITAERNNHIYVLETDTIERFYSRNQYTYCFCQNDEYKIKKRLYELENILDGKIFIRISNSCIINVKKIDCFDMGIVGNIVVKFKDGTIENVAKRRLSNVAKFLKERWD